MDFSRIDEKKNRLDGARPLPEHTQKSLRDNLVIKWTYHSNVRR